MNFLTWLINFIQIDFTLENENTHPEHITKVILLLMGATLLIFSPIVMFVILSDSGDIAWDGLAILAFIDLPVLLAWLLVRKGRWKVARHIPVMIFLALGFFGIYTFNFGTTFLLFFVLSTILSGYYYSQRTQLVILFVIMGGAAACSWISTGDLDLTLTAGITFAGLLIGVWLLQVMGNNLLQKSLRYQKELTAQLREEVKERKASEIKTAELNSSLEKRVAERTEQLINANQELYQVTYSIAHDLRAPVRAIIGLNEIVVKEHTAELDAEILKYLDKSIQAGSKIDRMLEELLYLLGLRDVEIEKTTIDLSALAERIFDRSNLQGTSVNILETPTAEGDFSLVSELLNQLISNAIKFSGEGSGKQIEFGALADYKNTIYYLKDNGIGISMNYTDQIFEPFISLHNQDEFQGTGIGLTIARRIVDLHHGNIWVESEQGEGSTFFFSLSDLNFPS
jgi:signal transduction histidine kinase